METKPSDISTYIKSELAKHSKQLIPIHLFYCYNKLCSNCILKRYGRLIARPKSLSIRLAEVMRAINRPLSVHEVFIGRIGHLRPWR